MNKDGLERGLSLWTWGAILLVLFLTPHLALAQSLRYSQDDIHLPRQADGDGTSPYHLVDAFPALQFDQPVSIVVPPGETNRLFIVERKGRVMVIPDLRNPTYARTFLDLRDQIISKVNEQGLLDIAFHPNFSENGFFYAIMTANMTWKGTTGVFNYLARYRTHYVSPNVALRSTELPIWAQIDWAPTHNPGDLFFGPDGYLYLTAGDNGGASAPNQTQRVDLSFRSGILRIDVDKRPSSLPPNEHQAVTDNYRIPPDNFLVGRTQWNGQTLDPSKVRTEFYAVGLRNPWRTWCDPVTGTIIAGDVGAFAFEELNIIRPGHNYGWAAREGPVAGPLDRAVSGLTEPVLSYPHGNDAPFKGQAIICGVKYGGDALPELRNKLIFGDHMVGRVWSVRIDEEKDEATEWEVAATTTVTDGIASFTEDPRDQEVLVCTMYAGRIKKMVRREVTPAQFPEYLSDTGLFLDTRQLIPHPSLEAYEVAIPFWSDGAIKSRWMALPDDGSTIDFAPEAPWNYPPGSLFVKHFDMPNEGEAPIRIETRVLMKTTNGLYGLSYQWNTAQTDARLVGEQGADRELTVMQDGTLETINWRIPSRDGCLLCHNQTAGEVLGFSALQLNCSINRGGAPTNQLAYLESRGCFSAALPPARGLLQLAPPDQAEASLDFRARSYLQANCANCHQPGTNLRGLWDARLQIPHAKNQIINGTLYGDPKPADARVLRPGAPAMSMIYRRMTEPDIRMPPLGSHRLDEPGIELIRQWIESIKERPDFETWMHAQASTSNETGRDDDPDHDGLPNYIEYLIESSPFIPAEQTAFRWYRHPFERPQLHISQPAGIDVQLDFTETLDTQWYTPDLSINRRWFPAENQSFQFDMNDLPQTGGFLRLRLVEP